MPFNRANVAAERIMNVITGLVTEPSNNRTTTTFPRNKWFDRECKVKKRRVNDVKKKFVALPYYPNCRDSYYQENKKYKNLVKAKKQNASSHLHSLLMTTYKRDPRNIWKIISRARLKQGVTSEVDPYKLREYFQVLNISSAQNKVSVPPALPYVSELDDPISHDEVLQAIARLKSLREPQGSMEYLQKFIRR